MAYSLITPIESPSEAYIGEQVTFSCYVSNLTEWALRFAANLRLVIGVEESEVMGGWQLLYPNGSGAWFLSFTMPDQDVEVWYRSFFDYYGTVVQDVDAARGPYYVRALEHIPELGPIPLIEQFWPTTEAFAGSEVTYRASIRNVGDQPGYFRLRVTRLLWPYVEASWTDFMAIPVGGIWTFSGTFPMPDFNILVELQAEWWDDPVLTWRDGGDPVGYSIAVVRDPWPEVGMPQELWNLLSGSYCNVYQGQWVSVTILGFTLSVPLWSFTPGIYARDTIQWTIEVVNTIIDGIRSLVVTAQEAWDKAWEAADAISDWTAGAFSWFTSRVGDWWNMTWPPIQEVFTATLDKLTVDLTEAWAFMGKLNDTLNSLIQDYESFKASIFDDILNLDIWQELKDGYNSFQEFATNPLDWIYNTVWDLFDWGFIKLYDWLMEEVE